MAGPYSIFTARASSSDQRRTSGIQEVRRGNQIRGNVISRCA